MAESKLGVAPPSSCTFQGELREVGALGGVRPAGTLGREQDSTRVDLLLEPRHELVASGPGHVRASRTWRAAGTRQCEPGENVRRASRLDARASRQGGDPPVKFAESDATSTSDATSAELFAGEQLPNGACRKTRQVGNFRDGKEGISLARRARDVWLCAHANRLPADRAAIHDCATIFSVAVVTNSADGCRPPMQVPCPRDEAIVRQLMGSLSWPRLKSGPLSSGIEGARTARSDSEAVTWYRRLAGWTTRRKISARSRDAPALLGQGHRR